MPQPMSIQSYRNIADLGMSQLALLTNNNGRTEIGSASAKVGFLQRLFNTSASKAVNIAITSDFKASLIREYGAKVAGCTVHFVDTGIDSGPIILQAAVPVLDDDTPETLHARIQVEEHKIYPEAIRLLAADRLEVRGRRVMVKP